MAKQTTVRPAGYKVEYSYAGFNYTLTKLASGNWVADPLPDEHGAAWKEKHRRAAVQDYLSEYGEG